MFGAIVTDAEAYDSWYETARGRWIGQSEAALLLAALQPRPGESLLDVGCGTGFFTRSLAPAVRGPVVGVDLNTEWVEYARRRDAVAAGYAVADARALPFADASFDLVVSLAALCFVEEERLAVREMIRVARRRIAIGLLNRHSLLWLSKGRKGGSGGYRGARWHSIGEARELLRALPVQRLGVCTGIHIPSGGPLARVAERLLPRCLRTGAFMLVVADVAKVDAAGARNAVAGTAPAARR